MKRGSMTKNMARTIEVVIRISEEDFEIMKHNVAIGRPICSLSEDKMVSIVARGIPLPEGHGDLKDMGNLPYMFDLTRENPIYSGKDIERAIKSMTTIIPAATESEGEE